MRAVLVVPVDDELQFALEGRLIFGDRRETQQLFQRSVKSLHDGNTTMLADGPKTRQDVLRLTPDVLEVLAFELSALIDNQVFGAICSADMMRSNTAVTSAEVGRLRKRRIRRNAARNDRSH